MGGSFVQNAIAMFADPAGKDDWRVRLSLPADDTLIAGLYGPLTEAGGLIFPYTPQVTFGSTATYDTTAVVHQNFPFQSYQSSAPNQITIAADFYVEDQAQAQYWIAAIHFLRMVTKMYTGDMDSSGSPPPILRLNGYGDFVLKNVPVVVTNFTITLNNDCDYISTEIKAGVSVSDTATGIVGSISLAGASVSSWFSAAAASAVDHKAHVPTKSTITIMLNPIYSRESARLFSLRDFSLGAYLTGGEFI
jgi:hypothetical protein